MALDRESREHSHRHGRGEQPGGKRRAGAEASDDDLRDIRDDYDRQGEGYERRAALNR
jgi:hypothetical protein